MTRRTLLACIVLLASAGTALAHDFWIETAPSAPPKETPTTVALRVGEHLVGEPVKRDALRIERFVVVGPDRKERAVTGKDGDDPAGTFVPTETGLHVVGYRGKRRTIELDAAKFEAYLREEGLERVIEERKRLGESEKPGKEAYSRCAKALVRTEGDVSPGAHDLKLGFTLELVPEKDPTLAPAGTEVPFRLLHDAKPVEGALVVALSPAAPKEPIRVRTDAEGRVRLRLPREGFWLVKAVHMVRADPVMVGGDWESLWASVVFHVPAEKKAEPVAPGVPAESAPSAPPAPQK